jgi:hypothetical protein
VPKRQRRTGPARWFSRRRRHLLAAAVTAVAVTAAGFTLFGFGTWLSCRSGDVQSYPAAYPNCVPSAQAAHLRMAGAALWALLVLAVVAVYLWIRARDASEPAPPPRRPEAVRRTNRTERSRRPEAVRRTDRAERSRRR